MVKKISPFNRIIEDANTQFQACNCKCTDVVAFVGANAYGAAWVFSGDQSCRKCGGGCGCGCGSGSQGQAGLGRSANEPLHS